MYKVSTIFISIIIGILYGLPTVDSCGCSTHNEVARRAAYWFAKSNHTYYSDLITRYPSAFQNGACFPDWGFPLPGMHDASEFSHWPPFFRVAVEHFRYKYAAPYDYNAQRYISFLFGAIAHSAADIPWHDLEITYEGYQGFIQSMADHDFFGNFANAHSTADVGGEFVVAYTMNTSYYAHEWYFPLEDMVEVFHKANFSYVWGKELLEGNTLLFSSVWAVHYFGAPLYPFAAGPSPFLAEQMNEFFSGGIDDMSYWSQDCWRDLINWIENGDYTTNCLLEPPLRHNYSASPHSRHRNHVIQMYKSDSLYRKLLDSFKDHVEVRKEGHGVILSINKDKFELNRKEWSKTFQEFIRSRVGGRFPWEQQQKVAHFEKKSRDVTAKACVTIDQLLRKGTALKFQLNDVRYSYLGNSLAFGDFNGDGVQDLAMGSYGYGVGELEQVGAVFILPGGTLPVNPVTVLDDATDTSGTQTLIGPGEYTRFGYAITTVDLNRDGLDDLVVSGPTTDAQNLHYRGTLYVYFGQKPASNGLILPATPSLVIEASQNHGGTFTNLGTRLYSWDVDGDGFKDLVIGSQHACDVTYICNRTVGALQRGMVAMFLSSKFSSNFLGKSVINVSNADWLQYGDNAYDWFGSHVNFFVDKNYRRTLLIGAPGTDQLTSNVTGDLDIGTLYGFDVTNIGSGVVTRKWQLIGDSNFSKLGSFTSIGNPLTNNPGDLMFIAVSSPDRTVKNPPFEWYQGGRVTMFDYGLLRHGNYSISDLNIVSVNYDAIGDFSRFGQYTLFKDIDNDGIADLVLGAPGFTVPQDFESNGEMGAIYVWKGGNTFPTPPVTLVDPVESSDWCLTLPDEELSRGAKFGWQVYVEDLNGDGQYEMIIAAPRQTASGWREMSGAVYVLTQPFP